MAVASLRKLLSRYFEAQYPESYSMLRALSIV